MPRFDLSILLIAISTALLACTGDAIVAPGVGNLRVITSTQGADTDTEYTVKLDAEEPRQIGASGSLSLTDLAPVDHTLALADVAPNCSIGGQNPRQVRVQPHQTAEVTFSVTCTSTTGSIVLRSITSGAFPDPDGYTVSVNGSRHTSMQAQAASHIVGLDPSSYLVEISGIAAHCRLAGESSRLVPVSAASTAVVDFAVACSSPPPIAFITNPNGGGIISLVNADGSGLTRLSQQQGTGPHRPIWSPDGTKIAFGLDDLYIMNPDGTGHTRLTTDLSVSDPWFGRSYPWAPDGSTIAVSAHDCPQPCRSHVWLARTDGSGATRLAEGWWPSWSPDGRTILFFNSEGVFTMGPDGSGLTRLDAAVRPYYGVWSPDGARIALIAGRDGGSGSEVFVMNRDGSGLVKLTQEGWDEDDLAWSPDGSRIALKTRPNDSRYYVSKIDIVMADGSGRRRLTDGPDYDSSPAWSPDGSQIAFVKVGGVLLDEEVYVISADGGVPVNVSNNPQIADVSPSWSSR